MLERAELLNIDKLPASTFKHVSADSGRNYHSHRQLSARQHAVVGLPRFLSKYNEQNYELQSILIGPRSSLIQTTTEGKSPLLPREQGLTVEGTALYPHETVYSISQQL